MYDYITKELMHTLSSFESLDLSKVNPCLDMLQLAAASVACSHGSCGKWTIHIGT